MYFAGGEIQGYVEGLLPSNNSLKYLNLYFSPYTFSKVKPSNLTRKTTGGVNFERQTKEHT